MTIESTQPARAAHSQSDTTTTGATAPRAGSGDLAEPGDTNFGGRI